MNKYDIAVIVMDKYHNRKIDIDNNKIFRANNWFDIKKNIFNYFF
jgi:hypothetical protein